jgi:hypothetical protein
VELSVYLIGEETDFERQDFLSKIDTVGQVITRRNQKKQDDYEERQQTPLTINSCLLFYEIPEIYRKGSIRFRHHYLTEPRCCSSSTSPTIKV